MAFTHALKQEKHKRGTQQFSSDSWGTCHLATPNSDDWSSFSCANCKILTNPLKIPRQNPSDPNAVLLVCVASISHNGSSNSPWWITTCSWKILCAYRVKGSRGQGMGVSQDFFLIETQQWIAGIWRKKNGIFSVDHSRCHLHSICTIPQSAGPYHSPMRGVLFGPH